MFGRVFSNQAPQAGAVDTGVRTSSTVDDGEWPIVVGVTQNGKKK